MHTTQDIITLLAKDEHSNIAISGVRNSAAAYVTTKVCNSLNKPCVCVLPSESQALLMAQDLRFFTDIPVFHYPGYEIPPYTPLSPDPHTTANRLNTLYKIQTINTPYLFVASCESLLRKVMPAEMLTNNAELVIAGEETDQSELSDRLVSIGFEQLNLVQNAGEFSLRGGIFDIFPPGFDYPIRLDFFGDTVESIRLFDPISQRSIKEIDEAEIIPVSDILYPEIRSNDHQKILSKLQTYRNNSNWSRQNNDIVKEKLANNYTFPGIEFFLPLFYDNLSDPLNYIHEESLVFIHEPHEIIRSIDIVWERINSNVNEAQANNSIALPPSDLFLDINKFNQKINNYQKIDLLDFEQIDLKPLVVMDEDFLASQTDESNQETQLPIPESQPITHSDENPSHNDEVTDPTLPVHHQKSKAQYNFKIHCTNHTLVKQHLELQRKKRGLFAPLSQYIIDWFNQSDQVIIACRTERHTHHLSELLSNHGLSSIICNKPNEIFTAKDTVALSPYPLSFGFDLPAEKIHFISEMELFGEKKIITNKKKRQDKTHTPVNFEELKIGDIVVHDAHGLGIYDGIINIKVGVIANDFLQIIYKNNDKLFVPVDRINSVSKYSGISDKKPVVSSLGSKKWQLTKQKVQEAVWKVAHELLTLYAKRKLKKGTAFSQPDSMFQELEESFAFEETTGQRKAISDVLKDLTSKQCMDRLVCGDVGFGKTEVAIRAAFKVVSDGAQVAILVPTTVLAEQHAQTFAERFQGFPVTIECLNRFRTPAQQRDIIKRLNVGMIDIIIGTHRILSKDVKFKDLGLLIIDEEHRFGVSHKEKLKMLRTGIDVLTLTATPIPRTLQMSLLGVRDLSIISSPPNNRRTVKTFIAKYDELVIKEAIIRELQRNGQVFLVHNRVRSIQELAFKVQKLVPDARIAVAHGQMPAKNLEEIMVQFVQNKIDVLICTTIIESGLDIPNANTIIINRADRMGLAEIYQLRGRVGRSNEQAFAYLMVPSLEYLSKDAKQRLRALMEYNELGGGFKLAMSDLQIRGGGNILGESQSGNIAAVGYDLYLDLLQKTVDDLKNREANGDQTIQIEEIEPEVNLNISAYISELYIPDPDQRYIAYRRISAIKTEADLNELQAEFVDRYGSLPDETNNLFLIVSLKDDLKKLKIVKLEQAPTSLVFSFHNNTPVSPQNILLFIQNSKNKIRLTPDGRLVVEFSSTTPQSIIDSIKNVLRSIW